MSISGMTIIEVSGGTISVGYRPGSVRGIHRRVSIGSGNRSRGMGLSGIHPSGILIGRHLRDRHPWGRVRYMSIRGKVDIAAELGRVCVGAIGTITITISDRVSSLSVCARFFVSA
jgi:hypothetical protein